jgi:hypothetical protein
MNDTYRPPSTKPAALAFLLAFLFFSVAFIVAQTCVITQLCAWMAAQSSQSAPAFADLQITYDSRIFLRPLQHVLQAFLYLIPFFHTGNIAAIFLTILFASLTAGLLILTAQHAGLPRLSGWLLVALFLTSPSVLSAVLSASGVSILVFFLALVFLHLTTWKNHAYWLALVWIGLGVSLAVLAQFSALFFLILPMLAALVIAFRHQPENIYYAENALWIMLTPLLYVFIVRFFFGYVLEGDPFAFSQFESSFLQDAPLKQSLALPILPRLAQFFNHTLTYIWLTNPAFTILSATTLILALVKRQLFPLVYLLALWVPPLLLRSSAQSGLYDPAAVIANLLLLSSLLLAVACAVLLKKNRWIFLLPALLLLAAWNGLQWILVL